MEHISLDFLITGSGTGKFSTDLYLVDTKKRSL